MGWRITIVVAAVVLAGCGSISEADPATDTVTPAPVPTVSGDGDAARTLPPGVTGSGVVDPGALIDAHMTEIRDRSFTLRVRVRSDHSHADRLLRVETPRRYYLRDSVTRPNRTITKFADGEYLYTNFSSPRSAEYGRSNVSSYPVATTVRLTEVFLGIENMTVAETLVDGEIRYELTGSYDVHPRVTDLENYSVRAVVTSEGFISAMNVSYRRDGSVPRTSVERSFRYSNVSTTDVERPTWVDENWADAAE